MYFIVANEIANVDLAEFEKVGSFHEVIAVPNVDISLTLKGMRASSLDSIEDCQDTLSLAYEPPCGETEIEVELLEDPFNAGIIYRREGHDFVELKYEQRLGALILYAYFLVDVNDCTFAYRDEDEIYIVDYEFLWREGFVRQRGD